MSRFALVLLSICLFAGSIWADESSEELLRRVIYDYMSVTGQRDRIPSQALSEIEQDHEAIRVKSGTPAVLNFQLVKDKLDKAMQLALGVQVVSRPDLPEFRDSPSGLFRVHYTTTGPDAVYTGVPGGATGYVDSVARIFDNVYSYLMDTLGYPPPPTDEFYPSGGDSKFDLYLTELGSQSVYGLTYLDSAFIDGPGIARGTAFMQIDNDFQGSAFSRYNSRPLDAVRVTAAHEFSHVVHFGLDFMEGRIRIVSVGGQLDTLIFPYWMEMSATWMEEEQYDNINDYYAYLPYFFLEPYAALERFIESGDVHPYASALFPLFLSEKYGAEINTAIWLKCGEVYGPNFFTAAEQVIDSTTLGAESWASSFREFALWNYFTGNRASLAPFGIGYEERADYPEFSDAVNSNVMHIHRGYPIPLVTPDPLSPDHNGAVYIRFEELPYLLYDTTYWLGGVEIDDTSTVYDSIHIDSNFTLSVSLDMQFDRDWGLSAIYRYNDNPDSIDYDLLFLPPQGSGSGGYDIVFVHPRQYRTLTLIFTPASSVASLYLPNDPHFVYYISDEELDADPSLANKPAVILAPYPNPAVVNDMNEPQVRFKFQVPTDSSGYPLYGLAYSGSDPYLVIDIYTVAGERVQSINHISDLDDRTGEYWMAWDMRNESGEDVASGVYIAYARFYSKESRGELLSEVTTKVAVIR